jgi:hypothetical protein
MHSYSQSSPSAADMHSYSQCHPSAADKQTNAQHCTDVQDRHSPENNSLPVQRSKILTGSSMEEVAATYSQESLHLFAQINHYDHLLHNANEGPVKI